MPIMPPSNQYDDDVDGGDDDMHDDNLLDSGSHNANNNLTTTTMMTMMMGGRRSSTTNDNAVNDDDDDDAGIGRYETAYSKLTASTRAAVVVSTTTTTTTMDGSSSSGGGGGGGVGAPRRGYGGTVLRAAPDDDDTDDQRKRILEFDRLDLDNDDLFHTDERGDNYESGDLFLDHDDNDDDVDNDDGEDVMKDVAHDRRSTRGEEADEEFGSISSDNDGENEADEDDDTVGTTNSVGTEFEAFRQSAATGRRRRRRQQNQHRSDPSSSLIAQQQENDDITDTNITNDLVDTTSSTSTASTNIAKEDNLPPPPPPTKTELLQFVDDLFFKCTDIDTMTVGGINRSIASHYGWAKMDKARKSIIKERLTLLITGKVKPGGGKNKKSYTEVDEEVEEDDEVMEEEEQEEEGSDEEELRKTTKEKQRQKKWDKKKRMMMMKKKSIKASKKHSKRMKEVDDEDESAENSGQENASMHGDTKNQDDASTSSSGGDDVGNDSSSDYEETKSFCSGKKKKKKTKSTTTTMKIEKTNNRRRRSTTASKSSGKMAKHLRDQHAKARRRQMEEARIRREELGHLADDDDDDVDADDNGEEGTKKKTKKLLLTGDDDNTKDEAEDNESKIPKMSEEDRQRAQAIAARFDTNRDELRVKRIEDRVGLIDRLRTKRLELISSSLSEDEEDKLTIADLAGKNKQEEEQMHRPKLTSTNNVGPRTNDMQSDPVGDDDDEKSSSSSSSNDDSDNEESEDDLEIIAQPNAPSASGCSSNMTSGTTKRTSTVDLVFQPSSNHQNRSANRKDPQKKASKPSANPLMALQNALRAKVLNSGNRWLARELGYKDEEDHIRDCREAEEKKRKQILVLEKEAALRDRERETALLRSQVLDDDDTGFMGEIARDDAMKMLGANDATATKYDDEEDEEMAMARELEQLEDDDVDGEDGYGAENDEGSVVNEESQELVADESKFPIETVEEVANGPDAKTAAILEADVSTQSMVVTPKDDFGDEEMSNKCPDASAVYIDGFTSNFANDKNEAGEVNDDDEAGEVNDAPNVSRSSRENSHMGEEYAAPDADESLHDNVEDNNLSDDTTRGEKSTSNKPKNSAWQAILLKEKAALAKEKRRQRKNGGLVEAEAEEEEEEEGIVGLEDFGFSVSKKKDDEDEDDGDVDEDDLDHVVDDLSDGEGDEEAGEVARKRLEQAEEKERHKEIIRRMREGYDGRRGGIASGVGGARGTLRFDQLVAADNRGDAKRLGLLNDDEMNSDDEQDDNKETKKDDEEEDEAALLDKMLKERFLNRDDDIYADENFTDDEESEDEADGAERNNADEDDDENREQERLAKHFEKRARRNRILEEFEGDTQFSRSRLIDEDVSMQHDLKTMKTLFCRKRSVEGSNLDFKENNGVSKKQKKDESDGATKSTSGLFLSVLASRRGVGGRKRTTTFVSGKEMKSGFSRSQSSSSGKSVALNHVVFVAGDNSSQLPDSSSRVSFVSDAKARGHSKVSKAPKSVAKGSSLWSKVCSKNFR